MNYEDAFRNYENGTATEEEKAFVKGELEKVRSISSIIDEDQVVEDPSPIRDADKDEIKTAKKQFKIKHLLFALGAVVVLIAIAGAILGGVFGSAAGYAKKAVVVDRQEAIEIGSVELLDWLNDRQEAMNNQLGNPAGTFTYALRDIHFDGIDTDFHYQTPVTDSYYYYKVEFEARGADYKVFIDSRDGKVVRIKIDD